MVKTSKTAKEKPVSKSSEPETMEDLLSYYSQKIYTPKMNEKVKGRVVKIEPGRLYVDINAKTEGLIAEKAYKEAENIIKTLKVGDEIEAFVIVTETRDGYTVLSLRNSVEEEIWDSISKSFENGTPLKVSCRMVTGAGVMVDVGSLSGFIPTSQIGKETLKTVQELPGTSFKAVVIDFDKSTRKIVLSEKEVSEAKEVAMMKNALKNVKVGAIYEGVVTTVYDFGCFVQIESEKDDIALEGLVHVSEMSWEKVANPSVLFKRGDKVKVKVIGNNQGAGKDSGKLAFSIKQAMEDPWTTVAEKYKPDDKVSGSVTKVSDYGAFVSLEPGLEGLIHITKIPPDRKLVRGDKVNVYVEEVDAKSKKISLGLVLTAKPMGYK